MNGVECLIERIKLGALAVALAITSCTAPTQIITPPPIETPKPIHTLAPMYNIPTHTPIPLPVTPTLLPTYTPTSTPTPIPAPEPTMPFDEQRVSELHSELLEIIKEIEPEVIGFGEMHTIDSITDYTPSTTTLFTEHLLEPLQQLGFNNLVWEGLYHNFPQEELEKYYRGDVVEKDSELYKMVLRQKDHTGAIFLLVKSANLGLNLYGSFVTYDEYFTLLNNCLKEGLSTDECEKATLGKRLELISIHAAEQANELLTLDKKIMLYGGGSHNNLVEEIAGENVSFGDDINTDSYLEVDLINPDLIYIYKSIESEDARVMVARLKACGLGINLLEGGVYRLSSGNKNRVVVLYPCRFEDCESVLSLY